MASHLRPAFMVAVAVGTAGVAGASCLFPPLDTLSSCAPGCGGSSAPAGAGGTATGTATTGSGIASSSGEGGATTTTTSTTSSTTTSGSTGTGSPPLCAFTPGMHGPAGVQIPSSDGFPTFCIDETEVTVGQFRTFYDGNNFPVPAQLIPPLCAWKPNVRASFRPKGQGGVDYIWGHYDSKDEEERPVQGTDWCDAAIFCAWSGKRLCGSENPAARHIDSSVPSWQQTGEWFRACGGEGQTAFGYGPTEMMTLCNTNGGPMGGQMSPFNTTNVTDPSTCVATWPAGMIHDMNGNVQEHEDNCEDGSAATPGADVCHPRGGAYVHAATYTSCKYAETKNLAYTRNKKAEYTGFRCCW